MFSLNKKIDADLKELMKINVYKNHRVLIKYKLFPSTILKKITSYKGTVLRHIEACNILCANINAKAIELLSEYPEIEYICLDQYLFLCGSSVSNANRIRFSTKVKFTGKGIGVGIIDSGVYPHRDLTLPENRIYTFIDLVNDLAYPYDDNGHGTCTCGVIGGNGESSNGSYKGIAPQCHIHLFKAFDKLGKGYASDILFSLEQLINMSNKYNIKILCLPFESLTYNSIVFNSFDILFKKAISYSLIPILPSGSNKNTQGSLTGIALSKNCITVSGIDTTSKIKSYEYSSCGQGKKDKKPDFTAACVDIVSLNSNTSYLSQKDNIKIYAPKLDTSYKNFTGTSLAAAYIAGICTLLFESNPNLSYDDIYSLLVLSSEELDIEQYSQGAGRININKIFK